MKKIITAGLLIMFAYVNSYGQDTSKLKNKKLPPYVKVYGPYTVTVDNGKITMVKNPNFDWSKVLKRDTTTIPSKWIGTIEIYNADSNTPILKKYLIYDLNSVSSERLMSKEERMAKYNSRAGVTVVHLKPGVIPVNIVELSSKFKVPKESVNLPLFVDFKPIANPDDLLAVPNAVLKIDVITDTDGFRFLNVVTKEWKAMIQRNAGKDIMYIR
ncbi:MAG TPA: hypothetical protein VIJ27_03035 [Mucilaginibacter sp.]